jgi:hypothetical protein
MPGKTAGTDALTLEIIMPRFEHFCLPDPVSKVPTGRQGFSAI